MQACAGSDPVREWNQRARNRAAAVSGESSSLDVDARDGHRAYWMNRLLETARELDAAVGLGAALTAALMGRMRECLEQIARLERFASGFPVGAASASGPEGPVDCLDAGASLDSTCRKESGAEEIGAAQATRAPAEGTVGARYRDYALAQLIFAARALAAAFVQGRPWRAGYFCVHCGRPVPVAEEARGHRQDCLVGRVLMWLEALAATPTAEPAVHVHVDARGLADPGSVEAAAGEATGGAR